MRESCAWCIFPASDYAMPHVAAPRRLPPAAELSLHVALSKGALPTGRPLIGSRNLQEYWMKLNKAALVLLLPLLISACDSQQPTYSASNANSAPPPPAAQPAPPPPPPVAEPAA